MADRTWWWLVHWVQGAEALLAHMDAPALFNRRALDKLVLQLTSSGMSASRVGATRSLSDVRMKAEAEASRNGSAAQLSGSGRPRSATRALRTRGNSSHRRPPQPREKRPIRTRPIATQQSMEVEAEASELTALLRCGNYSICVVRSDDLNRSNVGGIDRAHSDRQTRRPVSAPARDRIPVAATRQSRVVSCHGRVRLQGASSSSSEAQRTASSGSAQSRAYENPPPASDDECDSGSDETLDSDSVLADDELTDVPHSSSAPELRTRSKSSRRHRGFEGAEEELHSTLSGSRHARALTCPIPLSNDMRHQISSGPSSSRPSSAASNRRRRSRKKSSGARKTRALRRWVTEDQENARPVARENSRKMTLGRQTAAPPRPAGPPPGRSSSAIRSRAAAETMMAMR